MQTVDITLRSDHLEAVIKFAIEAAVNSGGEVNPLAWGDNENAVGIIPAGGSRLEIEVASDDAAVELITALEGMLQAVQASRGKYHSSLMVMPLPQHFAPPTAWVD